MKILVIHATAGAGHKKAAEAVYQGLKRHTSHQVTLVDSLDYTNPLFKYSYPRTYVFLVTKLAFLWQFLFGMLDIPFLQPAVRLIRRVYNGINTLALAKYLKEEQFDCIIATHFMSAEVSAYLKRTGQIRSKIICVVTDFDVHRIWINRGTDLYTCACDFTKDKIISLGIDAGAVHVTGIPTDEKFADLVSKEEIRRVLKIKPAMFTVLLATGSFGMGPLEELIELLKGYQLIIVCGHNKELFERLRPKATDQIHVFGLVNNMFDMMAAADVMVTKPGGLSIAEALVKKLPLIFFSAIPGQETSNIAVLKKYQAATDQGSNLQEIVQKVDDLSAHPQDYDQLRQKIEVLSKPNAVKDIIALL